MDKYNTYANKILYIRDKGGDGGVITYTYEISVDSHFWKSSEMDKYNTCANKILYI